MDNSGVFKWLATQTGLTNLHITPQVDNPTSAQAILFGFTASQTVFVHRIFVANDSTIPETYILQTKPSEAPDFTEVGRVTLEPGLTWRENYELVLADGDQIRMGIDDDPAATGTSIAVAEFLQTAPRKAG